MLKILGFLLKISLIGGIALFVGHLVQIKGQSLSDHAQNVIQKTEASNITQDIRRWAHQMSEPLSKITRPAARSAESMADDSEHVDDSEKRALGSFISRKAKN